MQKICTWLVLHSLTEVQVWWHMHCIWIHSYGGGAFLYRIVMFDETWANLYKPELKTVKWMVSPCSWILWQYPAQVNVMLTVAYNCEGVLLTRAVPCCGKFCVWLELLAIPPYYWNSWYIICIPHHVMATFAVTPCCGAWHCFMWPRQWLICSDCRILRYWNIYRTHWTWAPMIRTFSETLK